MDGQTHASSRKWAVFDQKNTRKIITPEKSETMYGKIRPFDIIPAMSLHAFTAFLLHYEICHAYTITP